MSSRDYHTFLPVVCLSCRSWHTRPSSMCCTVSEDSPWHPNTMTLSQQQLVFLFVCDWCDCPLSSTMYKYTPFQQCKSPSLKKTSWSHDTLTHACEAKWTFLNVSLSSQQTTKFTMKTKSRDCGTYMQWSCKFWWCNGFTVVHAKRNLPKTSREVSEDSSVQKENPRSRFAVAALELREACEELNWSRERSTPRRSHTNRSAERVARRKTEGLHEATECHDYLRNAQELVADGQTRYERRINSPLDALIFPNWSVVEKQSSASNLVLGIFSQSSSVAMLAQAISVRTCAVFLPFKSVSGFVLSKCLQPSFVVAHLWVHTLLGFVLCVLRVDLVLRVLNRVLVAVIVHSICIPNSCIFHIAKTGLLRCCLYTHVNCRTTVDHDQNAQLFMLMIQGEDPSARDPLSSSQWAKPRTWCGLSPCRRNTSHSTCLMFLLSPCLCSFLCLSLWPSLCLSLCLCSYLCLSWARRHPLVWCRSRPLCTIVCTLDASLSAHSWEHHTPAASSRSDQRVFRHSGSCGLCASIALIVSSCFVLSHKSFPLLQGLTSVSHTRKLQQLH